MSVQRALRPTQLLCIGLAAAVASLALTLAAIWGAVKGMDFLKGL